MAATGRSAILLGATGAVGKVLLGDLLGSAHYDQVHAFVRRPFKESSPHKANDKLIEHILDFDKLVDEKQGADSLKNVGAETVYITLGTTRAQAGSAKAFERIDREYVVQAAKAALLDKEEVQKIGQKVVYCSSAGSSSSSPFLYPKSKGLTEEGLASVGYSDCIIVRPGFLAGAQRSETRIGEAVFGAVFTHVLAHVTDSAEIQIPLLTKALLWAGMRGSAGLTTAGVGSPPSDKFKRGGSGTGTVTVISNAEAKRLSKEPL